MKSNTVPTFIAVPRYKEISLDGLRTTLETNKNSYWLVGRPHSTPPDPQLFERAYGVVILPTQKDLHLSSAQLNEKPNVAIEHASKARQPGRQRKGPNQPHRSEDVSVLEQQLEKAYEQCSSFKRTISTEKAKALKYEERDRKLAAKMDKTSKELECVMMEGNKVYGAHNLSGVISDVDDLFSKLATASCAKEKQRLHLQWRLQTKERVLQSEMEMIRSKKKMLAGRMVALKHVLGVEHCRCLLEMISTEFITLHKEKKHPDCPWPWAEDVPQNGVPYASSVADHAKAPCFDLAAAEFPQLKSLSELWMKLTQMIHKFAAGTVFIPAVFLSHTEEDLVRRVAAQLQLPTERVLLLP